MTAHKLPFENEQRLDVEVLAFEPWTKAKDTDFIFEVEDAVYSIVSPHGFRSKKLERGDKISITFERFKNNYGHDSARLKFLEKL